MAFDRCYLKDELTGEVFLLAKTMGGFQWYASPKHYPFEPALMEFLSDGVDEDGLLARRKLTVVYERDNNG